MGDKARAAIEIRAAQPALIEAEKYYNGDFREVFTSRRLAKYLDGAGERYRINFSRVPVTALLSRLEITHVGSPDDTVNELLARIWQHNRLELEHSDFHEKMLSLGECYALVWPSDTPGLADIILESPRTTRLFYDPEVPSRPLYAAKMWEEHDPDSPAGKQKIRYRLNLHYPDRLEKWVTRTDKTGDAEDDWVEYHDRWREADAGDIIRLGDDSDRYVVAEGGEIVPDWPFHHRYGLTVFHFRTGRPHGRPVHKDAYGPQNIITKITATHPSVMEFYAAPQRWWIEDALSEPETVDFDDEDNVSTAGKMQEVPSGPGHLWKLASGKVGEFSPASPGGFLEPLREYVQCMAAVTATPLQLFKGGADVPSGEARRAENDPLIRNAERTVQSANATWVDMLACAVTVSVSNNPDLDPDSDDLDPSDDRPVTADTEQPAAEVTIRWKPVGVTGDKDHAETIRIKRDAGVMSRRRGVEEAQPELDEDAVDKELELIEDEHGSFAPPDQLETDDELTRLLTGVTPGRQPQET